MNIRDLISWLLALLIVGAIVGAAFLTLAVLRPDFGPVPFDATE